MTQTAVRSGTPGLADLSSVLRREVRVLEALLRAPPEPAPLPELGAELVADLRWLEVERALVTELLAQDLGIPVAERPTSLDALARHAPPAWRRSLEGLRLRLGVLVDAVVAAPGPGIGAPRSLVALLR